MRLAVFCHLKEGTEGGQVEDVSPFSLIGGLIEANIKNRAFGPGNGAFSLFSNIEIFIFLPAPHLLPGSIETFIGLKVVSIVSGLHPSESLGALEALGAARH